MKYKSLKDQVKSLKSRLEIQVDIARKALIKAETSRQELRILEERLIARDSEVLYLQEQRNLALKRAAEAEKMKDSKRLRLENIRLKKEIAFLQRKVHMKKLCKAWL